MVGDSTVALAEKEGQPERGETEKDADEDRQPIEIALDDGRTSQVGCGDATAEHVRQSTTLPGVQQHQGREAQGQDDVDDDRDGSEKVHGCLDRRQ